MKFTNYEEKIQVLDKQSNVWSIIQDITKTDQEEAFYICDIGDIVEKYLNWKKYMPRIETFYAVKCNDHPLVLEVLAALDTGFDCASKEEISKILKLDVSPNRIIFANPTKPESHIQYAESVGVSKMTFDNELELEKIKRSHPNAETVLRIKYDDKTAQYRFGEKFGCDHETEAPELLARALELEIKVVGVSFHIGSGSQTPSVYAEAIRASRHVFDIAAEMGFKFDFLDIGGGFPGARGTSIEEISKYINESINLHFSDPSIKIISEPGRYYVDSAFTIATRIHSIATTEPDTSTGLVTYMYYINSGVYNNFINVWFNEKYQPQALKAKKCSQNYPTIIWGPTCDSFDKVCENIEMPKMNIGDWIGFENVGAYTLTLSNKFNGFPVPKVHAVVDEKTWDKLKNIMSHPEARFVYGNCKDNLRTGLGENALQTISLS